MKLKHIISAVIDRCGDPIKTDLGKRFVFQEISAALEMADAELTQSSNGHARAKFAGTIAGGSRTGTISYSPSAPDGMDIDAVFENVASLIPPYLEIEILEDEESVINYEREGKRGILFTGLNQGGAYTLSWLPTVDIPVTVWSKTLLLSLAAKTLDSVSGVPSMFDYLIINRATMGSLDYLLRPGVKGNWIPFVEARKASIFQELETFESRWLVFREEMPDDDGIVVREFYDPVADLMRD